MSALQAAIHQLVAVRKYATHLIDSVDANDWFRMPTPGVTHVAWQVAHMATAEYWLTLNRVRGLRPSDENLISEAFRKQFGRESIPNPNPDSNPKPAEIRAAFDRVHEQALSELPNFPESEWSQPVARPHPMFGTKLEAIQWSSAHEWLHVGQIGLLRRLFGQPHLW